MLWVNVHKIGSIFMMIHQANQLWKGVPYGFWSQTNEFSLGSSSANDLLCDLLKFPFYIYKMITQLH